MFAHHPITDGVKGWKVIHDAVWGTHRFEKHEIDVLNTPLLQRLRQINQTANALWTYPSLRHSRFEHTLGMTIQVSRLCRALEEKLKECNRPGISEDLLDKETTLNLRMAALLHDCGHGPFSHASEEIYGLMPIFKSLKEVDKNLVSAKPHEMLSYLIIKSDAFIEISGKVFGKAFPGFDVELCSNTIVGHPLRPELDYLTDIINGPFDSDKLDYLLRDGHFSGLPLTVDLERLWHAVNIAGIKTEDGKEEYRRLTVDWGGVPCLEQIVFMKMILYPTLYHHHKVRAADCMFKGIIEYIQKKLQILNRNGIKLDFSSPVHYLYLTDYDFYDSLLRDSSPELHKLLHDLQFRRLLKRAVVISESTIENEGDGIDNIKEFIEDPINDNGRNEFRECAEEIWELAGKPGLIEQIWVDCPKNPEFAEASDAYITPFNDENPMDLTRFFQVDQYQEQYKHIKWKGHVFCREEDIERIRPALIEVFKKRYGVSFNQFAFELCQANYPQKHQQ